MSTIKTLQAKARKLEREARFEADESNIHARRSARLEGEAQAIRDHIADLRASTTPTTSPKIGAGR